MDHQNDRFNVQHEVDPEANTKKNTVVTEANLVKQFKLPIQSF